MKLSQLMIGVDAAYADGEMEIEGITCDSRRVKPGWAFVCIQGTAADGHAFAQKAVEAGASLVVAQRDLGLACQLMVPSTRRAWARMSANWFGNPAEKLHLVGITGTNGKTSTTYMLKAIMEACGYKVGLIGTIQNMIGDRVLPAGHTTPDPYDLQSMLSLMAAEGCTYAVMEVSSHALDQDRVEGCAFDVAVFTNLTQDHLDYHKTFENYFAAKKSLFSQVKHMVVNLDDSYGRRLLDEVHGPERITFSAGDDAADYTARNIRLSASGVKFEMVGRGFIQRIDFPMPGDYSVHNALAAAAAAIALGIPARDAAAALSASRGVRGRCEVLYHGAFTILCDYAHTGDAIEKVLAGVAPFVEGRLVVLYGCAGERDAKKRPLMSEAVVKYADFAVLTSDNPRKEDPCAIIKDAEPVLAASGKPYIVEVERRTAVNRALDMLRPGDVLALCGKGHEDYQVIDGVTLYLDEHRIVREWLERKGLDKA